MFYTALRTVVMAVLPKAASDLYEYMFEDNEPKKKTGNIITASRKVSDTTPITQYMYDFICNEHKYWIDNNHKLPNGVIAHTQQELTDHINQRMGTDKSKSAIARVFNGHVDRANLPTGTPIFVVTSKVD